MSSASEQAAVQAASDAVAYNYIVIASLVFLAYDTLLTLFEESSYIWEKKWKLGTALYFLARYSTLLYIVIEVIFNALNSSSLQHNRTCNGLVHFNDALGNLPLIGVQGLLLAKAYAATDHKRLVLAILSILGVCAIVTDVIGAVSDGCDITSAQNHTVIIFGDVTSIVTILFDAIVVVVTLAGTLGTWRIHKKSTWNRMTLTHLLAEQSLLRFGFVLTMTVANATLPLILRPTLTAIIGPIQNNLSTIIICRFHLGLQRKNADPNSNASRDSPTISIGGFRAASRRMHDAVMAEFGGSLVDESVEAEAMTDEIVTPDPDMSSETTGDEVEVEAFQSRRQSTGIMEA